MKKKIDKPKVFISYAWGTEEYKEKVLSLARALVSDGIDVELDMWSLKEGHDTYTYMERMVNDDSITNVLILIDPVYAEKANVKKGGVGTETQIISPEIYEETNQEKFLPVVFERDDEGRIQKPIYLNSRYHFDLSVPERYNAEYERMVRRLYGIDNVSKPEIGNEPEWLEKDDTASVHEQIKYSSLKKNNNTNKNLDFRNYLDDVKKELLELYADEENNDIGLIEFYNKIISVRDKFLELLQYVDYIESPERILAEFLEQITFELNQDINNTNTDLFKTAINEWFIYIISTFIKKKMYKNANYLFEKTFFTERHDNQSINHRFSVFRNVDRHRFDKIICDRDEKNYHCGTAQFWIDNIYIKYYSKEDFTFADVMCYNASIYLRDYNEDYYWFPLTYVYALDNKIWWNFITRLKSTENINEISTLFSVENADDFKKRFTEVGEVMKNGYLENYRYPNSFDSAPLINHSISEEDIGVYN